MDCDNIIWPESTPCRTVSADSMGAIAPPPTQPKTYGATPLLSPQQAHTHTHLMALSRTTWVSQYQKGKTNLDFTEARDSKW